MVLGVVVPDVDAGIVPVSGKMKERTDAGDRGGRCRRRGKQMACYRRLCGAELSGSSA